jgi:hypothetical protein
MPAPLVATVISVTQISLVAKEKVLPLATPGMEDYRCLLADGYGQ